MIYEKINSADNSLDEEESVGDLQDAEHFFKDKNYRFARRYGELKGEHFVQILNGLLEEQGHAEQEGKTVKYDMGNASVSSISTILSQNELWEAIDRRRSSTPNLQFGRPYSGKALSSVSGTTKKSRTQLDDSPTSKRNRIEPDEFVVPTFNIDADKLKTKVERLQVQIDKMKEIHELEINSMQTAYQNKFKEAIQGKVDDLKGRFESEIRSTLGELSELKLKLIEKDNLITKINALLLQQEKQLAEYKVKLDKELFESRMFQKKGAAMESSKQIQELQNENLTLQKEVDSIKAICTVYKKDTERAIQERNQAVKEAMETRKKYEKILQETETKYKTEIMLLQAKNSDHVENIQKLKQETEALQRQINENQQKNEKQKEALYAQIEETNKKFAKYKEVVEVELKVLRHMDHRASQSPDRSEQRAEQKPQNRDSKQHKTERFQTPESLSSEGRKSNSRKLSGAPEVGRQGSPKLGKRGTTPQGSDGPVYTASMHMALNSGEYSVKGSTAPKNKFEEMMSRGRQHSRQNSRQNSEGSSSSHSQSKLVVSRDVSPMSRDKNSELPSLIISKKVTPELQDLKRIPGKYRSHGGSPTNLHIEVSPASTPHQSHFRTLEQSSYTPLKSIMETNRERDPQLLQSIDMKNLKEQRPTQKKPTQKEFVLGEELQAKPIQYVKKPSSKSNKRHDRVQTSIIQAKSLLNASLLETGISFRPRTRQMSMQGDRDSLNQTAYSWGARKTHRMKTTKDNFGLNLSITSKNTNKSTLNDSSYI